MKYYCNPLNIEYKYQAVRHLMRGDENPKVFFYREAADPSLVLFKGLYYLFPSMEAGFFTSNNLTEWDFHPLGGNIPIYDYAPDVCVVGDYLYL
jgi:hypothetical protein